MCADATGKPHLDMQEVTSYMASLNQVAGKKKSKKQNFVSKSKKFAPAQLSQMRQVLFANSSARTRMLEYTSVLRKRLIVFLTLSSFSLAADNGGVHAASAGRKCSHAQSIYPKPTCAGVYCRFFWLQDFFEWMRA
jgi:hypothetical protein